MSVSIPSTELPSEVASSIDAFIAQTPNATHTINEREKGVPLVDLCRGSGEGGVVGKDCREIAQEVTKVFAYMTKQGFFCQVPFDPSHTEIECVRISKIVARQS